MRSDKIRRTAQDYLFSHEERLERLEREQRVVSVSVVEAANVLNGGNSTYAEDSPPLSPRVGDLWIDTDANNSMYRWDGTEWLLLQSQSIPAQEAAFAQRLLNAQTLEARSTGVINSYIQTFSPGPRDPGDLWLDTDIDVLYRYEAPFGENTLTNLHRDPSLESGAEGCGTSVDSALYTVTSDSSVSYSGAKSRKSVRSNNRTSGAAAISRIVLSPEGPANTRRIIVSPGDVISVAYRVKVDTPALLNLNVIFFDSSGERVSVESDPSSELVEVQTRWKRIQRQNLTVPAGTSYMSFRLEALTPDGADTVGGETLWVEAASVNTGSEIGPYFDPYVSGTVSWLGTPGASASRYRPEWLSTEDGAVAPLQDEPSVEDIATARTVATFYQMLRPTSIDRVHGDMWVDTADFDRLYLWIGSDWVQAYGAGVEQVFSELQNKTTTYYQPDPPQSSLLTVGDLWFDTDSGNRPHRWDGTAWIEFTWGAEAVQDLQPPDTPTSAPTPIVQGGIGSLFISWGETGADEASVSVYVSTDPIVSPVSTNLVGTVLNSGPGLLSIRALADGTVLRPGVNYNVVLTVSNMSGVSPVSAQVTGQLGLVTGPDIAVNAVTTDMLLANHAVVGALQVEGLDANVIRTGILNAERVSIGSTTAGSMVINGNMEDAVTASTGEVLNNSFAGWGISQVEGVPQGSLSEEVLSPLSGTRSMRLNVTAIPGIRVIQNRAYPVTDGYRWRVTAQVRASRTIDQSSTGTKLAEITFHTSTGALDPDSAAGTTVIWQTAAGSETLLANTPIQLDGFVTVPAGHRRAKVSVKAYAALDGIPWILTVDEVTAGPVEPEFQIVDPVSGGLVASITRTGDITGHDIDYSGVLNINDALFRGEPLDNTISRGAGGLISWGSLTPAITGITTETGVMAMDVYMDNARSCVLHATGSVESLTDTQRFNVRIRYNYSATSQPAAATTSSTLLRGVPLSTIGGAGNNIFFSPMTLAHLEQGYYSFIVSVAPLGSGVTMNTIGLWEFFLVDQGQNIGSLNQAYVPGTTAPPGRTYTKTYDATDGSSWNGSNTLIGTRTDNLVFGKSATASGGNRKAAIWFDDTRIRSDLAGATVQKVELYLYATSGGSGNTVVIGTHGDSTPRNNWTNILSRSLDEYRSTSWSVGAGRWVDLGNSSGWKTGSKRGIILGPGPTESDKYAMGVSAVSTGKHPVLRITYQR